MIKVFRIPSFSSWNGPASLAHVVQVLTDMGVPATGVRLLPVIGHPAHREILPYRDLLCESVDNFVKQSLVEQSLKDLRIRLGVNVRVDNRLAPFISLVMLGMPPTEVALARLKGDKPFGVSMLSWYREQYIHRHTEHADFSTAETPVECLMRQLYEQYPDLGESSPPNERPHDRLLFIRHGHVMELSKEDICFYEIEDLTEESLYSRLAQEFAELIFTNAFLFVAMTDLLGGCEFFFPFEPEGRHIPVTLGAQSRVEDVVQWLHLYPHRPLSFLNYGKGSRGIPRQGDSITRDNEQGDPTQAEQTLWTAQDPAVQEVYKAIRQQYEAGRTEDLTPDEVLALARRYLPEYIPFYPSQCSIFEGLNLSGALIHLMRSWWHNDAFLGIKQESMNFFLPEEKVVLEMLILLRRHLIDWFALFQTALRLLVHRDIQVRIEPLAPAPSRLGTTLAQVGQTLFVSMIPLLHSPQVVVYIPMDRTQPSEWIEVIEKKLEVLACLFVPVHLPICYRWLVDWAILGAYLAQAVQGHGAEWVETPLARLAGGSPIMGDILEGVQ